MRATLLIAAANIGRFVRNRSFLVLAIVAPFGIIAALSTTIGPALSGEFRPSLVLADEVGGGLVDRTVDGLRESGFDDLRVVASEAEARRLVDDGEAGAAVVFPARLSRSLADPGGEPTAIRVIGDADADITTAVAEAVAAQTGRGIDTVRVLQGLGAPATDLSGSLTVTEAEAGTRVLTDGTYFAVGMTSYFAFFAASALVASIHRERRESTLARMLVAPIARFAPLVGKGLAAGSVALISFLVLVGLSTALLDAGWGPLPGVVAIGVALCVAAVGVAMALVTVTTTEESAGQIGAVLATAWAMFGGVFLPLPPTGFLAGVTRLSPFRWVVEGIGLNAGTGSTGEVLVSAAAVAAFGLVGGAIAFARRNHLGVG
jgi:ABC-2 type transport system permease protein